MFGAKADESLVGGEVAPGFEAVEREFKENFARRRELGAACAAYHEGEKVVDLWGGYRDFERRAPWEEDTLVLVYSTTKGIGGSLGFADPDAQIGFAYAMTGPGFRIFDDPRAKALRDALYGCLEKV